MEGLTRYDATATCLPWIPPTAVEGVFSLPFGMGVAHHDQPPPDELPDVEALLAHPHTIWPDEHDPGLGHLAVGASDIGDENLHLH